MIEVQDSKSAGLVTAQQVTGSVPVILPRLLPAVRTPSAGKSSELFSVVLIVVLPTVFWCAAISIVRSLMGLETGNIALACIAVLIGGFLMIIRASLMIDRSA